MKNCLLLLAAAGFLNGAAQSSFQVKDNPTQALYAPNAVIQEVTTFGGENVKTYLDVKNISASSKTVNVKRYDMTLNVVNTTTADAYFCFGGLCYGSGTSECPNPVALNANQSTSQIPGLYYVLTADLDEALDGVGYSLVRYTFYDFNNVNDSVQISIQYNTQKFSTAQYTFTAVTPTTGVNDPTGLPVLYGVNFGAFSAVGTSANSNSASVFGFAGWSTGATNGDDVAANMTGSINPASYYMVSLGPAAGYSLTLNSITFDVGRSGDGIRNYAVRAAVDNYAQNQPASITGTNTNLASNAGNDFLWKADATTGIQSGSKIMLNLGGFKNFSTSMGFRFYGWNSEGNAGTFVLDNVTFDGFASVKFSDPGNGVGIVSHDLNAGFTMYPNPSYDGSVTLDTHLENAKIEVLNIMGQVILSQNSGSIDGKITLNLAALATGTYFVKVNSGTTAYTEKIVISK